MGSVDRRQPPLLRAISQCESIPPILQFEVRETHVPEATAQEHQLLLYPWRQGQDRETLLGVWLYQMWRHKLNRVSVTRRAVTNV